MLTSKYVFSRIFIGYFPLTNFIRGSDRVLATFFTTDHKILLPEELPLAFKRLIDTLASDVDLLYQLIFFSSQAVSFQSNTSRLWPSPANNGCTAFGFARHFNDTTSSL
jgi:hypothetical protein